MPTTDANARRATQPDEPTGAAVFAAIPTALAVLSPDGTVTAVNTAWCELTGDTTDADVGRPVWQRAAPAERTHVAAIVQRVRDAVDATRSRPTVTGTRLRRAGGGGVDVVLRVTGVATPGGDGATALVVQVEPLATEPTPAARRPGTGDRQLALAGVARAVTAGGPMPQIARSVLAAVARATGCPLVGLWRRRDRRHALVLTDAIGFDARARGRLTLGTEPDGLAGHALRARGVVVFGGRTGTAATVPHVLRDRGVTGGAAVPSYGVAGADALLTVCSPHNQPLPPEDVRLLAVVGDLVGLALQREAAEDLVAAERRRTLQVAADLDDLHRRHALTRELADVHEWTWIAPAPVTTDRRVEPPPRWSLRACLDTGPQALVDLAVPDAAEGLADALNASLDHDDGLECAADLRTCDGTLPVRLRGLIERDDTGAPRRVFGVAVVAHPRAAPAPGPSAARLSRTAHDLNTLLAAMLGTAEQLAGHGPDRQRLTAIVRAGRRARELAAGMGGDHDHEHPLASAYDLADVVEQLRPLLPGLVGPGIRLEYALGRGARTLAPARDDLERVLLDLVSNGRDALGDSGTIVIATDTCVQLDAAADRPRTPPVGSWARLRVSDDGVGISPSARDHVFEAGYTTKRGRHSGLGLAAAHETVASAGGVVTIESTPDEGTTVQVYLPLASTAPVRLQPLRRSDVGATAPAAEPAAESRAASG